MEKAQLKKKKRTVNVRFKKAFQANNFSRLKWVDQLYYHDFSRQNDFRKLWKLY